ncbi:unnamed protein product [Gordionus sp. m RMFG-2023]|uniref:ribosome production factor 1-like n=1 Tax=Gordionus sp. m RMFG-2023 TaxID=3053472 RepID=UPI0030E18161
MLEKKPISEIKNKIKRREIFLKTQKQQNRQNKKRKEKNQETSEKGVTHTIESLREPDETFVNETNALEIVNNEFEQYFQQSVKPNIAITSSYHPYKKTNKFCRDLETIIPNSKYYIRKKTNLSILLPKAIEKGFTDLVFVNEDKKIPSSLMICHLPNGPTTLYKILNFKLSFAFKKNSRKYPEQPEVVLNNFTTTLGHTIGKMFAVLFPQTPDFVHRRLVTFHNQRDYIFFRHHRYQFKNGEKVALQELGPRFTLRLQFLQRGLFDPNHGDYEWSLKRHQMEKSRRKFYL